MKKEEIKYDGSFEEMFRLGLVDETGSEINSRRNELNQYMATVWAKNHPNEKSPYAEKIPSTEDVKEYFEKREKEKAASISSRRFWSRIFGRDK